FEESLRTPLVVRWPGVTDAGSSSDHIVSNLDFAQTFLDMAGVDDTDEMQGQSLVPLLRGEQPANWRDEFYYHYYELGTHNVAAHYGIVTDQYKLVHYYRRLNEDREPVDIDQWDLMDRVKDPLEMTSYIDDPAYADVREDLLDRLLALQDRFQVDDE
ncbi:MAG: sulfatase/phosphatase domain-containing protein, partial [Pirellulaceae bacterium]